MRHRIAGRKLGRTSSHRIAMLRNMVSSLLIHERIRTTEAKAKELRRVAERMITLGKRGDLHARRQAAAVVRGRQATRKLFTDLADRYREIRGGYTKTVKLGRRRGDGAMLSLVELVIPEKATPARQKRSPKRSAGRKPAKKAEEARTAALRSPRKKPEGTSPPPRTRRKKKADETGKRENEEAS